MPISLLDLERSLEELMDIREELLTEPAGLRDPSERSHAIQVVEEALADYVKREVVKVDGIHKHCRYAAATAAAARAEAAILIEKANRLEAQEARLKDLCMTVMVAMGKQKLEGTAGRVIARQKSGGLKALQVQDDVLPDTFCDFTLKLSGDTLAQVLAFLPRFWKDRLTSQYKKREPSQERIREEMAQPCLTCNGVGFTAAPVEGQAIPKCRDCDGAGTNRVAGAQLLERGETIRIR